jgi:hypothetical protein
MLVNSVAEIIGQDLCSYSTYFVFPIIGSIKDLRGLEVLFDGSKTELNRIQLGAIWWKVH